MAKKLRDEDLVLNIIVNGNKGKKEMNELNRAIKDTSAEVRKLEKAQKDLRDQGKQNTDQYRTLSAAIQEKNKAIQFAESRLTQLRKGMKLTEMSTGDLRKEQKRLRDLMSTALPGSENYIQYEKRLGEVNGRLNELRGNAEKTGFSLSKLAGKANHYFALITAGFVTLVAAVTGVQKVITDFAEFDDKLTDVQKTTGLTKEEVKELNKELKKIDTRTQQLDLLGLARVAGKLGYESKKDIEGFVRATDQISVALTEDLGGDVEQSINQVGKLVDIFKVDDEFGVEKSILKVGSAINVLGASSTANEGYLVEFSRRMAGVAPLAGISIQQILALGATLDQFGQTSEVSSTALSKLFLKMSSDAASFAKYAGMSVDEFKQNLEKDFMGTFIKVLEGVKGSAGGINALADTLGDLGLDGGRVIGVLGTLANNTDVLRHQVDLSNKSFQEGTSITEEYTTKNTSAAAELEKHRKALYNITVELGEKLYPVMSISLSGFSYFVKILSVLTDFFIENRRVIATVVAGLIGYNAALAISNMLSGQSVVLKKAEIVWSKLQVFWNAAITGGLHLLSAAYALTRGNIAAAKAEMIAFNTVTRLNPLALLAGALAAVVIGLIAFTGRLSSAEVALKTLRDTEAEAAKSIAAQKVEMEQLLKVARDKTRSDDERAAAIKKINDLSPEYLGFLNLENINTTKAKAATDDYIESLLKVARVKAAQAKLQNIEERRIDLEISGKGSELNFGQELMVGAANGLNMPGLGARIAGSARGRNYMKAKADLDAEESAVDAYINRNQIKAPSGETEEQRLAREEAERLAAEKRKKAEEAEKDRKEREKQNKKAAEEREKKRKQEESEAQRRERQEAKYRASLINKLNEEIEQENEAHQQRLTRAGLFGKDRKKMTEEQLKALETLEDIHRAKLNTIDAKSIRDNFEQKQRAFETELAKRRDLHNIEMADVRTLAQAKLMLESELSPRALQNITTLAEAKKELQKKYAREEAEFAREHLEALLLELQQLQEKGELQGINLSDAVLSEDEKEELEKRILELRKLLAQLKNPGTEDTEDEAARSAIDKLDVLGFSGSDWENLFENLRSGKVGVDEIMMATQALIGAWGMYSQFVEAGEKRQLQQFETSTNKKKETLKRSLDAKRISQQKYTQELEKLDKQLDQKRAELEYKQAKREKQIQLMSAIAGTASAVVSALGAKPWTPANFALAAIVGAIGAVQIGTIVKTPLPTMEGREDGGYLDVTRAQDGKRFRAKNEPNRRGFIRRPTVITGESGDEFVLSNAAVNNPTISPLLDVIDTAQRNGSISTLNLMNSLYGSRSSTRVPGRAQGGTIEENGSGVAAAASLSVTDPRMFMLIEQNTAVMLRLEERLKDPITAEVAMLGPKGFIEKQRELTTLQNNANL